MAICILSQVPIHFTPFNFHDHMYINNIYMHFALVVFFICLSILSTGVNVYMSLSFILGQVY